MPKHKIHSVLGGQHAPVYPVKIKPCRFRYECLFRRKIDSVNLRHEPCCTSARRIRKLYRKTFITENLDKAATHIFAAYRFLFMVSCVLDTDTLIVIP